MISASRRWFRRHRTPIAIGVGVIGFGYVATQYLLGKIQDARERINNDRIARENLRRRFEQNQEDCTLTVLALLPTAADNILAELGTEKITHELQQQKAAKIARAGTAHHNLTSSEVPSVTDEDGKSITSLQSESGVHASQVVIPPSTEVGNNSMEGVETEQKAKKSKLQLWNDLKISAITRAFTLIYTLALLTLLTRIQLNLLGRRSYLSSVVSLATSVMNHQSTISLENHDDDNSEQVYGNDFETNKMYLTFSWWLLHRGWRDIMLKVEAAVREVFGTLSPRDELSFDKFSNLTLEVRKKIEGSTPIDRQQSKWLQYLLPPRDQEEFVLEESGIKEKEALPTSPTCSLSTNSALRRLLDETSDLIDAPPFTHILTLLLDAGFSTLVDQKISQHVYKIPPISLASDDRIQEVTDEIAVKLPSILALLTRQAHSIGNGAPNEYLQSMEKVRELEAFAAVVYSSNWESLVNSAPNEGTNQIIDGRNQQDDLVMVSMQEADESLIDIDTASKFESIWEKAVNTSDEK
ncbi:Peroxisomal biogenesis factor 3 [Erysiphe neolycopersici]|uniref:Peroxisomal biogenesis factor 3 n=1 Tax=Erysiphe neolycopersici TaxID=212602 RepID=A0A420HDG4_9PEZI|nr:Peroxisomal biogenesis factor 3 [Erysiphe neolycopersici]